MDKAERGVAVSGAGWILSGIISALISVYKIPPDVSLFGIGVFVSIIGASLIILRKRVLRLRDGILARKQKARQAEYLKGRAD